MIASLLKPLLNIGTRCRHFIFSLLVSFCFLKVRQFRPAPSRSPIVHTYWNPDWTASRSRTDCRIPNHAHLASETSLSLPLAYSSRSLLQVNILYPARDHFGADARRNQSQRYRYVLTYLVRVRRLLLKDLLPGPTHWTSSRR